MPKIQRKKVIIESRSYNFDKCYEKAMEDFDDVLVINIHVLSVTENVDTHREEYLVFFQEIELVETDED